MILYFILYRSSLAGAFGACPLYSFFKIHVSPESPMSGKKAVDPQICADFLR